MNSKEEKLDWHIREELSNGNVFFKKVDLILIVTETLRQRELST